MNNNGFPENANLTVPEMARYLRIGLNRAYDLIKMAGFPAVRVTPRRVIIPVKALNEWLNEQAGKNVQRG